MQIYLCWGGEHSYCCFLGELSGFSIEGKRSFAIPKYAFFGILIILSWVIFKTQEEPFTFPLTCLKKIQKEQHAPGREITLS